MFGLFRPMSHGYRIGLGLTFLGVVFLFMGVLFLFDTALLTLGNVLFISGIFSLIGLRRTFTLFFGDRGRWAGTGCFALGFVLVLFRWPIIGMMIEVTGLFQLFFRFLPIVVGALRQLPIIGNFLRMPGVKNFVDYLTGSGKSLLPV